MQPGATSGALKMRRKKLTQTAKATAVVVVQKSRPDALAAALMAVLVLREVGWSLAPAELQGMASKGLGAFLVLVLLAAVWLRWPRSGWLDAATGYGAWSALQTLLCSCAYMASPWTVPPGVGICSARVGFDLGALGLLVAALFAMRASGVNSYRSAKTE
jgi:hypothetical protein